ncbi:MAG: cupin domain-containing protein [Deltaproteobacteria bacterium]|nr:cupin domain-containing protein [Deltaproteobacteria bacterium]MBI3293350.1 cupin domain-containing protein [Deltaproteobacteria bacterium]
MADLERRGLAVALTEMSLSEQLDNAPKPADPGQASLILGSTKTCKLVTKHWGYEKWIVHAGAPFAFKLLFLKAGFRTSLQYHEKKEECMLLLSGWVRLHYQDEAGLPKTMDLNAGHTIHVKPNTVHRVEAINDSFYAEVSTAELDDVIRIQDDNGRPDGHIAREHKGKA